MSIIYKFKNGEKLLENEAKEFFEIGGSCPTCKFYNSSDINICKECLSGMDKYIESEYEKVGD